MAQRHTRRRIPSLASFASEYAKAKDPDELVIPEDLSELSNEDLSALTAQATEAFTALREGEISDETLEQMEALAGGIEALAAETATREAAAADRRAKADELAARVTPEAEADCEECAEDSAEVAVEDGDDADEADEAEDKVVAEVDAETGEVTDKEAVAASAVKRKSVRVNLSGLRSRQGQTPSRPVTKASQMSDIVTAAPDLPGYSNGQGMDFLDLGKAVDRRLTGFNTSQYARAAEANRHMRQQFGVAVIRKPIPDELMIKSDDPGHVDSVIQHAMDEKRLPGGSLVASGGWCAPSETVYDLCELESRDGLISVPEIGIARGGIRWTTGPDFAEIYSSTGFCYTEADDIAGDYDGAGGGSKPCFKVDCPDFTEKRLGLCGTCIQAGLLQSRGYPEVIARTIRGSLVAHEHRVAAAVISDLVAGSTAVSLPANQVGAIAPILTAIELQVEHMKYLHRMARGTSMEAVFPFWVRGAIRADLSRRLGVELLSVTDAQINGWFTSRGINPQFVYNWQDFAGAPSTAVSYPTSVQFLLYPAGTWVKGTSDIISLDTLYDSTLLGTNDYSALFMEEGWLTAKLCQDSRVVTVPICADGATAAGVAIACDGSEVPAA